MVNSIVALIDFDGTLVDSHEYLNEILQRVTGIDRRAIASTFGRPTRGPWTQREGRYSASS